MNQAFISREELQSAFHRVLADLLAATSASRTTLRLDLAQLAIGVDDPVAEALMPGVRPLSGETGLDQRALNTVRWLAEHRRCLIQDSCRDADPSPPQALIDVYGVQAQMLGPVIRNDELVAWVSVHENRTVRKWTEADVAALEQSVAKIHEILDAARV